MFFGGLRDYCRCIYTTTSVTMVALTICDSREDWRLRNRPGYGADFHSQPAVLRCPHTPAISLFCRPTVTLSAHLRRSNDTLCVVFRGPHPEAYNRASFAPYPQEDGYSAQSPTVAPHIFRTVSRERLYLA